MVFDIILYMTLQRLMGQKSLVFLGFLVLGMRDMNVWFNSDGIVPALRTERATAMTSEPTVLQ